MCVSMQRIDMTSSRWKDINTLLTREGNLVGPGFEPGPELLESLQSEDMRVLCVGAGGLGCEILKVSISNHADLASDRARLRRVPLFEPAGSGAVWDCAHRRHRHGHYRRFESESTVPVQVRGFAAIGGEYCLRANACLDRTREVGKSKAIIAAERINARVSGVKVQLNGSLRVVSCNSTACAQVTPHHCRIEEKPADFYRQFTVSSLSLTLSCSSLSSLLASEIAA